MNYTYIQNVTIVSCGKCSLPIALTESHLAHLKTTHETFYCPAGHPRFFSAETELEKMRKRLSETIEKSQVVSADLFKAEAQIERLQRKITRERAARKK